MAAQSKDLFAFSDSISNLLPNRSLDALRLLGMTALLRIQNVRKADTFIFHFPLSIEQRKLLVKLQFVQKAAVFSYMLFSIFLQISLDFLLT